MPLNFALKSQAEKGIEHQFTTETVRTCSLVTMLCDREFHARAWAHGPA